jgi:lipoate---protein ligase
MNFELRTLPYDLPDIDILNNYSEDKKFFLWIPDKTYIVLGVSNKAEDSLISENVINDNIAVYKRPSGGESVVLTPDMIIISVVSVYVELKSPKEYFKIQNLNIIKALELLGVKDLNEKGISDIAIREKKILGSSIYRTRDKIFYQAVLNVKGNTEIFERYLKHPQKEPDYRKHRGHSEFVTSLNAEGYTFELETLLKSLDQVFNNL